MAAIEQLTGLRAGHVFPMLGDSLKIGRSDECDVRVTLPAVSRQHCEILRTDSGFILRDLGSRNQTVLNGKKIQSDESLVDSDEIQVSAIRFRFLEQDSLREDSGSWGIRAAVITIDSPDDDSEAEEEKSIRREEVFPGQKISDSSLNHGHINGNRIATRIEIADGSGGWPVVNECVVKLNQVLQLMHQMRRRTTVDEILGGCLKHLFEVFPLAQNIAVVLSSDDADGIHVAAAVSRHAQTPEVQVCLPVIRQAMQNREALLYTDHWKDHSSGEQPGGILKSIMVNPMTSTSSFCRGAIQLECSANPSGFEPKDLERLAILTHVVSVLIDQAREREARHRRWSQSNISASATGEDGGLPESEILGQGIRLHSAQLSLRQPGSIVFEKLILGSGQIGLMMIAPPDRQGVSSTDTQLAVRLLAKALIETECTSQALEQLQNEWQVRPGGGGLSACVSILNSADATLTCSMAGYFPVFQVRNQSVTVVPPQGMAGPPLGSNWPRYDKAVWSIPAEGRMLICSNGVLGILNSQGQVLSQEQLREILQELVDRQDDPFPGALCHRLKEYQTSELLLDDVAFTMLTRSARAGYDDGGPSQLESKTKPS